MPKLHCPHTRKLGGCWKLQYVMPSTPSTDHKMLYPVVHIHGGHAVSQDILLAAVIMKSCYTYASLQRQAIHPGFSCNCIGALLFTYTSNCSSLEANAIRRWVNSPLLQCATSAQGRLSTRLSGLNICVCVLWAHFSTMLIALWNSSNVSAP